MRKPTDPCLLCLSNLATKKNSHIFPRFISTNFLGPKGAPRRGLSLSSETPSKKPRVIQDSPKEDYILCERCEAYFSVLETIASDTFINWRSKVSSGEYSSKTITPDLDVVELTSVDARVIHLFIYSIFWRSSISSHSLFDDFKIESGFEEKLRDQLMLYCHDKHSDFIGGLAKTQTFEVFPSIIFTGKSFEDETANVLMSPFSYKPYSLIVDRFAFALYKTENEIDLFLRQFSNRTLKELKLIVLSEKLWHDTIVKKAFDLYAKKSKGH